MHYFRKIGYFSRVKLIQDGVEVEKNPPARHFLSCFFFPVGSKNPALLRLSRDCAGALPFYLWWWTRWWIKAAYNVCGLDCILGLSSPRIAHLRMEVEWAAPGSQVLPNFGLISWPWRAASADQGSFVRSLLGKRQEIFVHISFEQRFCCIQNICCPGIHTENPCVFSPKITQTCPDPKRLW